MANAEHPPQPRRRSSVFYDPARDTSTEILDPVRGAPDVSNSAVTSSPEAPKSTEKSMTSEESHKRRRSPSAEAEAHRNNDSRVPLPKRRCSPAEDIDGKKETEDKTTLQDTIALPNPANRRPPGSRITPDANPLYSRRPDRPRGDDNARNTPPPNRRPHSRSPRRLSPPAESIYHRRSPPRLKRQRTRSPSPIRDSPPREHRRPGGARGRGRNVLAEQQRLEAERERASAQRNQHLAVQQASNNFYNARPEWVKERGRDWRKNESKIKGLRSFNNWIKSCIIQKFSPEEKGPEEELGWGEVPKEPEEQKPLLVLDIGCGKGGDLGKWQLAKQQVGLYVGLDPARTSIEQANDRYQGMRRGRKPIFEARFVTKDCFGEWIGDVNIVREVGIDQNAGAGGSSRWGGGGFDVVSMMFSMHYAFESEEKVRMMLRNVAGSLKKGGRFLGVVPNSDALAERIQDWYKGREGVNGDAPPNAGPTDQAASSTTADHIAPSSADTAPSWGNSIYSVRFPDNAADVPSAPHPSLPPSSGEFRPPFAWKYTYWMAEAVDVPEFVVPWEAFRAIALDFNLEQRWRRPFLEIWEKEGKGDDEMVALARRMGVLTHDGNGLAMSEEEREAVAFYAGFCFVKV